MEKYSLSWTCANCRTANEQELSKYEAAFCELPGPTLSCINCQSSKFSTLTKSQPDIDADLLKEWIDQTYPKSSRKRTFVISEGLDIAVSLASLDAKLIACLYASERGANYAINVLALSIMQSVAFGGLCPSEKRESLENFLKTHGPILKKMPEIRQYFRDKLKKLRQ